MGTLCLCIIMADTEMVDVNVGGQSAQSQSETKPEPGFTYWPLQFLMVLFAIGGLVLVIVAGTTEFPVVYDENQWIKLRVMRSTSDRPARRYGQRHCCHRQGLLQRLRCADCP